MGTSDVGGVGNILSMLGPEQKNALIMKGQQALASGQVKPEEVQSVSEHPAFQKLINGGEAPTPDAFKKLLNPKSQKKDETKDTDTNKTIETRNHYQSGEDFGANMDKIANLPFMKNAQMSLDQQQGALNMQRSQVPQNDASAWIRPLAALTDSQTGSKLSEAANQMPTAAGKLAGISSAQNELQKRKDDLAKMTFEGAKQLKDGKNESQISSLQTQFNSLAQGQGMNSLANSRLAAIPIRAGQDFDKQTANATRSIEQFNKGDQLLNNKNIPMTNNTLNQIQQDVSNGLTAGGQATDAKTAMDMQTTLAGILQQAKAKYGVWDPEKDDLRKKAPEVVAQIQKVLGAVREDYKDSIHRQADQMSKTYEASYNDIPNLRETVEAKKDYLKSRFPKSEHFNQTGAFEAPKAGPPVDADLGKMSKAELKAYIATHGG